MHNLRAYSGTLGVHYRFKKAWSGTVEKLTDEKIANLLTAGLLIVAVIALFVR